MCSSAVPLLVLVAGPIVFLTIRFVGLGSAAVRWTLGLLVLGILFTAAPEDGYDATQLDRVKLVLSVAIVAVLALAGDASRTEIRRFGLAVLAAAAVLAHTNFFAFHGRGSFAHVHDVAHYYLGSKYAAELPYGDLYVAIALADVELHAGAPPGDRARDLATGALVPIGELLQRSESTRSRFTDDRWQSFRGDVEAIHRMMGERFPALLADHGYNPTPVWSLVGGTIANRVPAGSIEGIRALTLVDPLLLAVAFLAVLWAFGFETACLAAAYYGILYGAIFDWVGGAFLRNLWFAGTLVGASLLQRAHPIAAGACLGVSVALRVFPVFFLLGPAAALARSLDPRKLFHKPDALFLVSSVAVGASLVLATLVSGSGIGRWLEFQRNLIAHTDMLSSNMVGIPAWLRYGALGIGFGGSASTEELFSPTSTTGRLLVAFFLVGSSFVAARLSLRIDDPAGRMAVGLFPIVFGLQLAHYYYVALVLLVLAHRSAPARLALVFGAEACLYVLALFEAHFSVMCLFRGLVTAYLLVALWFDDLVGVEAR